MLIKKGSIASKTNEVFPHAIECTNCKWPGHIIDKCWAPGGGMAGMRPPVESVRCRRFGKMGHYTSQCKKSNNQANAFYDAHGFYDQIKSHMAFIKMMMMTMMILNQCLSQLLTFTLARTPIFTNGVRNRVMSM